MICGLLGKTAFAAPAAAEHQNTLYVLHNWGIIPSAY
jgi:hypothetical protein